MERLDYSNFGRFCHCAYRGLNDVTCPDYLLGKHCRYMPYGRMVAFYRRFKDAAQYICDLDSFVYHLKWLDQGSRTDLTREAVLADFMGPARLINDDFVDQLHFRYKADIDALVSDLMRSEIDCFVNGHNDDLPF